MSTLTWPDDIQRIEIRLTDEPVKVCVYHDKARACSPMAQQPCLDVVWSNVALDEHVMVEEYHSCCDIIGCPTKELQTFELIVREVILSVQLDT
jgi:hypothetical protein